jgi:hypothetical protein
MSCMARSRNLVAIAGSSPLENTNQTWPKWSNWSIADATASLSFEPRQTAAFIVILKFGLTAASLPRSVSLSASTCIPSTSAAARRTERNSSRSAFDWRGTSNAATVLILSGCDATPQPTITEQIVANASRHMLAPFMGDFWMPWNSILPPAGDGLGAINISPPSAGLGRKSRHGPVAGTRDRRLPSNQIANFPSSLPHTHPRPLIMSPTDGGYNLQRSRRMLPRRRYLIPDRACHE